MSLLDTASLIVTPNGYKEGKLYSVIPSDGSGDLSVTRATTATRVNSQGLVELVPYNLVQYSQELNNAYWSKYQGVVTANTTIAPDGTLTADTLTNSLSAVASIYNPSISNSGTNTISCYFKKGTHDYVFLELGGSAYNFCSFNISNGTIEVISGFSNVTIEDEGNGWYRCYATASDSASTIFVGVGTAGSPDAGDVTYIWGFQVNEGSAIKPYQKTETRLNIPRLDYSNGTCPSLLVEPQRTNNVFWSNNFSTAKAYNYQNASQSSTTITAPDGLPTTGITSDTSSSIFHRFFKSVDASSNTFTSSIYAKQGTSRYLGLGVNHNGSASTNNIVVFDLQDGVIASNPYSIAATIELLSNGWYRLTHTYTYTGATAVDICVHNAGVSTYTTSGFQVFDSPTAPTTLYIFGLQFELGSYATSYIPTTSASVTRNADVISKTGISSLIGQTEGVIFYDFILSTTGVDFTLGNLYSSSNGNSYSLLYINPSNQIGASLTDNGITQCEIVVPTLSLGRHKIAFAYKSNDFAVYVDGQLIGTDTSGSVPNMDSFNMVNFNLAPNAYRQEVNIYASALWKQRLTNTQLAQLTTI